MADRGIKQQIRNEKTFVSLRDVSKLKNFAFGRFFLKVFFDGKLKLKVEVWFCCKLTLINDKDVSNVFSDLYKVCPNKTIKNYSHISVHHQIKSRKLQPVSRRLNLQV